MTDSPGKPPRAVILAFVADVVALIVCLVSTIQDVSPWPAFVVALCAFGASGLIWFSLKRQGRFHPLATSAWALGLSALAWSIGLLAAAA
jgi:hypothetical protein